MVKIIIKKYKDNIILDNVWYYEIFLLIDIDVNENESLVLMKMDHYI